MLYKHSNTVAMESPEAAWVAPLCGPATSRAMVMTRLDKLEQENGGLQSRLSKLEQENGDLRSRLAKLEPPSEHHGMQFRSKAKDVYFEVPVYMDTLPSMDTLRRCLMRQEGVTALNLLPAVRRSPLSRRRLQDVEGQWTGQDNRPTGTLEGIVEHPCTAHQLAAAILSTWKDFLVPEEGLFRLVECQPEFWVCCAHAQEGSKRWTTKEHLTDIVAAEPRANLYGAAQDEVVFTSPAAFEAAKAAIASLEDFSLRFG